MEFSKRILKKTAAILYGGVTSLRNTLYDKGLLSSYKCKLPVVSVGNLTAGGNGKTPLAIFLVEQFKARGWSPVVLTRGYGGTLKGPHLVSSTDAPSSVGDEPLLISVRTGSPVVVARKRAEGAKFIIEKQIGNIIILDDGFQHRALKHDVDLIAAYVGNEEASAEFRAGELLPLGRFRENRDRALSRADIFVACDREVGTAQPSLQDASILSLLPSAMKMYSCKLEAQPIVGLVSGKTLTDTQVVAFSGIASPEGFYRSLLFSGISLVATRSYADHHPFSGADMEELLRLYPALPLVCTEKDAVKLRCLPNHLLTNVFVLKVAARVVPTDAFMVHIERLLRADA